MPFLYGDSTPSTLEINYIDFLRDALDFSAQVLVADERRRGGSARADELRRAAEIEVVRLESFGDAISRAVVVAMSAAGAGDSPITPCAQAVMRASAELVSSAIDRVRGDAEGEIARHASLADRDAGGALQALGTLLLRHDLPDATTEVRVALGEGAYVARLHVHALEDLEAVIDLDIADDHAFAHPLRVDKLVERLEVHAPEISGWLRKEVKLKPQRLDREYVTELTVSGTETRITLRSSLEGASAGYDVVARRASPRVSLTRVGEGAELPAFDLTDEDETRMLELEEKLVAHAGELIDARRALVEATLGGQSLADHPSPRAMVERLAAKMAPVVQEIARHSLTQTELVLKRLLDNGRREEIFVSRQELEQKLESLMDGGQAFLAMLGLSEPHRPAAVAPAPSPVAQAPAVAPAPAPAVVPPPEPVPLVAPVARAEEPTARPIASQPPPASTESQRPAAPAAPRPGSLAPPRPSRPVPAPTVPTPSTPTEGGWGEGGEGKTG